MAEGPVEKDTRNVNNKDGPSGPSPYMALALLGQLGLSVALPIVAAVFLGNYLDRYLGAHGVVLVFALLLGIIAGAYDAWKLIVKVMGTDTWKK